jgi:hypothetical protein
MPPSSAYTIQILYTKANKGITFITGSRLCKQYRYDSKDEVKARRARNAKHNRDYRANIKRQRNGKRRWWAIRATSGPGQKKAHAPKRKY